MFRQTRGESVRDGRELRGRRAAAGGSRVNSDARDSTVFLIHSMTRVTQGASHTPLTNQNTEHRFQPLSEEVMELTFNVL